MTESAALPIAHVHAWRIEQRRIHGAGPRGWCSRNPDKVAAQKLFQNAVRRGDIVREAKCEWCHCPRVIQAHHDDYSRPLDVIFLCIGCHFRRHGELRDAARTGAEPPPLRRPVYRTMFSDPTRLAELRAESRRARRRWRKEQATGNKVTAADCIAPAMTRAA